LLGLHSLRHTGAPGFINYQTLISAALKAPALATASITPKPMTWTSRGTHNVIITTAAPLT
jgi:hypothetical protein